MHDPDPAKADALPGNHGQFGQSVGTEDYKPLLVTQRVKVSPVVPRSHRSIQEGVDPKIADKADDKSEAHPS